MAEQVDELEHELKTTQALQEEIILQPPSSQIQSNKLNTDEDLIEENSDEDRRWPYFKKSVMKWSLHYPAQSAICVPMKFKEEHPDIFQKGNLITLEGPSGNEWKVRTTDRPVLQSGWRAFAYDHRLHEGDQLCFNLTKPSHFVVDICDSNGDFRFSALTATNTGKYAVADVCLTPRTPAQQVSRKRKPDMENSPISEAGYGYGMFHSTIADRCKVTARRGCHNGYALGTMARFSNNSRQWECHEEEDGREVVIILDSDDDEEDEDEVEEEYEEDQEGDHELDDIELSFGSAQVQSFRSNKIEKLFDYIKGRGDCASPKSKIPTQVVKANKEKMVAAAEQLKKNRLEIAGHGEDQNVAEQHENDHVDEEKQTPSDIVGKVAKTAVIKKLVNNDREEKLDSSVDPLRQAQASCDEDMTMKENEEETHLGVISMNNVELQNPLDNIRDAGVRTSGAIPNYSPLPHKIQDISPILLPKVNVLSTSAPKNALRSAMEESPKTGSPIQGTNAKFDNADAMKCKKLVQSRGFPTTSEEEETRAQHEFSKVGLLTEDAELPPNSRQESQISIAAMSDSQFESNCTLSSTDKDVKMVVMSGSTTQGKVQEAEGGILFETLQTIFDMPEIDAMNADQKDSVHLTKSRDPQHEELHRILQPPSSASEAFEKSCELPVTEVKLGYGASEETEEKVTMQQSNDLQTTNCMTPQVQNEDSMSTAMASGISTPVTEELSPLPSESCNKKDTIKEMSSLEEPKVGRPQRKLEFTETPVAHEKENPRHNQAKPTIQRSPSTTCVLKSKRGPVAKIDREKAVKAAQTWAKKLRNANFVAVMKDSNVYTDFNMGIPTEFAKKSKLPLTWAKVTLVCDEVPTTCKAIWEGNNHENANLNPNGWMEFSRTHFLEEGDVCVFELFNRVTVRIGVHIFRVAGLKKELLDWTQHYTMLGEADPHT